MQEKRREAVPAGTAFFVMNTGGDVNNPPRARTRVLGQPCSPTGILDESSCSPTTGACERAREGGKTPIRDRAAYFRAWRIAMFGGDFDPVRVAVEEAVAAFSSRQPERDRETDRKADGGRIGAALRRLNAADRAFARAVLRGRTWRDSGMTKQGFNKRLKKSAISFQPGNHWAKSHFPNGGGADSVSAPRLLPTVYEGTCGRRR